MSTHNPTGIQHRRVGPSAHPTRDDGPSVVVRLRRIVIERDRIRVLMLESTFNGAPFFGGLVAYAHATPSLLSSIGVQPAPWTSSVAYGACILLTWIIGGVINAIADGRYDKEGNSQQNAAWTRRHNVQRIARLCSTATMLSGLLISAHNPTEESLATWPLAVMTTLYLAYEVLHRLARRGRKDVAKRGDGGPFLPRPAETADHAATHHAPENQLPHPTPGTPPQAAHTRSDGSTRDYDRQSVR